MLDNISENIRLLDNSTDEVRHDVRRGYDDKAGVVSRKYVYGVMVLGVVIVCGLMLDSMKIKDDIGFEKEGNIQNGTLEHLGGKPPKSIVSQNVLPLLDVSYVDKVHESVLFSSEKLNASNGNDSYVVMNMHFLNQINNSVRIYESSEYYGAHRFNIKYPKLKYDEYPCNIKWRWCFNINFNETSTWDNIEINIVFNMFSLENGFDKLIIRHYNETFIDMPIIHSGMGDHGKIERHKYYMNTGNNKTICIELQTDETIIDKGIDFDVIIDYHKQINISKENYESEYRIYQSNNDYGYELENKLDILLDQLHKQMNQIISEAFEHSNGLNTEIKYDGNTSQVLGAKVINSLLAGKPFVVGIIGNEHYKDLNKNLTEFWINAGVKGSSFSVRNIQNDTNIVGLGTENFDILSPLNNDIDNSIIKEYDILVLNVTNKSHQNNRLYFGKYVNHAMLLNAVTIFPSNLSFSYNNNTMDSSVTLTWWILTSGIQFLNKNKLDLQNYLNGNDIHGLKQYLFMKSNNHKKYELIQNIRNNSIKPFPIQSIPFQLHTDSRYIYNTHFKLIDYLYYPTKLNDLKRIGWIYNNHYLTYNKEFHKNHLLSENNISLHDHIIFNKYYIQFLVKIPKYSTGMISIRNCGNDLIIYINSIHDTSFTNKLTNNCDITGLNHGKYIITILQNYIDNVNPTQIHTIIAK